MRQRFVTLAITQLKALSPDEALDVIAAMRRNQTVWGMTGEGRALLRNWANTFEQKDKISDRPMRGEKADPTWRAAGPLFDLLVQVPPWAEISVDMTRTLACYVRVAINSRDCKVRNYFVTLAIEQLQALFPDEALNIIAVMRRNKTVWGVTGEDGDRLRSQVEISARGFEAEVAYLGATDLCQQKERVARCISAANALCNDRARRIRFEDLMSRRSGTSLGEAANAARQALRANPRPDF